jgi:hypothetical protein
VTAASRTVSSAITSSSELEDSGDDMPLVLKQGFGIWPAAAGRAEDGWVIGSFSNRAFDDTVGQR